MTPAERFQKLINFKGFGNPDITNIFCFVGLEEAISFDIEDYDILDHIIRDNYYDEFKVLESSDYYLEKQKWEKNHPGRKYTQIYGIIGKIVNCYRGFDDFYDKNFKNYYKDFLNGIFNKDGHCFLMNIYPLGKPQDIDWPLHYSNPNWFGLISREDYLNKIKDYNRFDKLFKFWDLRKKNFIFTICFGNGHWGDFRNIFKLNVKDNISNNSDIELYLEEKIILTQFFNYRFLSNDKIRNLVDLIRNR